MKIGLSNVLLATLFNAVNNIGERESGVTMLNNIVDNIGPHNLVNRS